MKRIIENAGSIIKVIYQNIVYLIFTFFVIWLTFLSGFSTCFLNNATEHTYFVKDTIIINLGVLCCFIFLLYFFHSKESYKKLNRKLDDDKYFLILKSILIGIIFIVCFFIAICSRAIPHADFMEVMKSAYELKNGNYERFYADGYVGAYPHQIGIVVFLHFFSIIFGDYNFLAFQFMNAVAIAVIYKELSDISKILGMGRVSQLLVLIFGIFFLPYNILVIFVYGTILGLATAITGIKYAILFVNEYKIKNAAISALCITFSTILKSNYLIFLIAVLIYVFMEIFRSHKTESVKILCYIAFLVALYLLQGFALDKYISNKTGHTIGEGTSSWAWIAMGLQDNTNKANGWFNGYNKDTYRNNNYDSDKQEAEAKQYIKERLGFFLENKKDAIKFGGEKFASQWNNPNFECFNMLYQEKSNIAPP